MKVVAKDLGVEVSQVEWLPDTADCEHLRMVVGGEERRVEFSKTQIKNLVHHELALEGVLVKVIRALHRKA